ncbi:uncharacterized protein BO66DRAFT_183949 [Aspergillus aculeatinus CBS 121060]|uniref:Uncharacterized protein n=1 Tax=Aspergillus aculeatinus CBS 121060 TaxID=1448322 RepID=A0ACD1GXZ3_9EURO|nr:hypothetical protein BO66DRAFT_183949 [Aspergillus aculeatinus CBS 121060]RAH66346.1 hypothetical protein BO66DRAFT_183949 [Aspergillus aculeatinus CBS 121060]
MIINMKTILISLSLVGCIISTATANAFSRTSKRPFSDERHLLTMQPSCQDPKTSTSMLLTQTRPLSEAWKGPATYAPRPAPRPSAATGDTPNAAATASTATAVETSLAVEVKIQTHDVHNNNNKITTSALHDPKAC